MPAEPQKMWKSQALVAEGRQSFAVFIHAEKTLRLEAGSQSASCWYSAPINLRADVLDPTEEAFPATSYWAAKLTGTKLSKKKRLWCVAPPHGTGVTLIIGVCTAGLHSRVRQEHTEALVYASPRDVFAHHCSLVCEGLKKESPEFAKQKVKQSPPFCNILLTHPRGPIFEVPVLRFLALQTSTTAQPLEWSDVNADSLSMPPSVRSWCLSASVPCCLRVKDGKRHIDFRVYKRRFLTIVGFWNHVCRKELYVCFLLHLQSTNLCLLR